MRRRHELRELAFAVNAGFAGGEAIDNSLPIIEMTPERETLKQEGFETEKWWGYYASEN